MPGGFKIATAYVSVQPDDSGFEPALREKIKAAAAVASEGVKADVGLEVRPETLAAFAPALGATVGEQLTDALGDTVGKELPAKLEEPIRASATDAAATFVRALSEEVEDEVPEQFRPNVFGDGLTGLMGDQGTSAGQAFTAKFSHSVTDALTQSSIAGALAPDGPVGEPMIEEADKTGKEVGKKIGTSAGESAGESMSPILMGALVGGLALAPAALLTAASVATVGLGALVVKSNADVEAEYHHLASDVGATLSTATAPLVPAVEASLVQVDGMVKEVAPTVKSLFVDAEPDLFQFTQGLDSAAEEFLPRFQQAVNSSRGIVADFSQGLPAVAAGAGDFFDGLTTDSQSTARGFESFEQLTGTALGTAGHLIGSFAAGASTDLRAVVPAADAVLDVINKLASPATVGALAGGLGAAKFGSSIQSGLQSASNAVTNFAAKADGMGGAVGKLAPAAESAAGGLSSMADVMGGPWGIAIGAGIGLLGGLVSSMSQGVSSASDFTAAIQQDSGEVGANTEATIQQTIAKADLSDLNQQLGADTATLIAYAAGDKSAQQQVTAAYQAKQQALNTASNAQTIHSKAEADGTTATEAQANALDNAKARLDQVTSSVAQAIAQTNEQTKSLQAAERATDVFTQQVNAEKLALQQNQQTAKINATALNELLPVQGQLSTAAINASLAYSQAQQATSAYTGALQALYGQYGDTSQAQAQYTTALNGLHGQITSGTNAVNLNSAAGAKNYAAFQQAASAAVTYSEKLEQQTGSADQADAALKQAITQIDAMATKSGLTASQVQKLNEELFGVKSASDIHISVNDSQVNDAVRAMEQLNSQISKAGGQSGHVLAFGTRATGGPAETGVPLITGDGGVPEVFVPQTNGYIYPSVQEGQQAIAQHNAQVAASNPGRGSAAGGRGPVTFIFNGQKPNIEEMAQLKRTFASAVGV